MAWSGGGGAAPKTQVHPQQSGGLGERRGACQVMGGLVGVGARAMPSDGMPLRGARAS